LIEKALVTAGMRLTAQTSHDASRVRRAGGAVPIAWTTNWLRPAAMGRNAARTSLSAPAARANGACGVRESSFGAEE